MLLVPAVALGTIEEDPLASTRIDNTEPPVSFTINRHFRHQHQRLGYRIGVATNIVQNSVCQPVRGFYDGIVVNKLSQMPCMELPSSSQTSAIYHAVCQEQLHSQVTCAKKH